MANSAQIKNLNRLRGALKSKLTRFENYLEKPIDEIEIIELKGKLTQSALLKENFEERQTQIEALVSDEDLENEYAERGDFEDRLSAACARAQRLVNIKESVTPIAPPARESNNTESQNRQPITPGPSSQNNEQPINLKLPALNLPSFSGSYEKWPGFSDTFKSSVHNDKRFTDCQRLVYLRSCLTDKAADKIESLETTDANYQVAWRILEKYYDDPVAVINNHIKSFFELPNCQNASASSIGDMLNNVTKHYRALEALNKPFLEAFPIYAITSKLDYQTRVKWKEYIQGTFPTMEILLDFLHCREKVLETNKSMSKDEKSERGVPRNDNTNRSGNRVRQANSNQNRAASTYSIQTRPFCHICKNSHFTQNCEQLVKATIPERLDIVKNLNLCYNCLRSNHSVNECNASTCKTCNKKHHTLLHQDNNTQRKQVNFANLHNTDSSRVLLSTAVIHVLDHKGNPHTCRALLDNGSQVNFLTERMATKLGLRQCKVDIPLGGVNKMSSSVQKMTRTTIQSRLNRYSTILSFLITPEINDHAPSERINRVDLKIPANLHLADPEFHIPGTIDALIGAEIFLKLLCVGQISLANNNAVLQKTHFGWILGGTTPGAKSKNVAMCNLSLNLLHDQISKFWEIENEPHQKGLSNEENECEKHYMDSTTRDPVSGRYTVKLPFKENINELGESYSRALKRFYSLERSLSKNLNHKDQYSNFLREYEELGHMSEDKSASTYDGYFLPHHSVIKQSSLTTKLRVVFDASAKTSTGVSLNDTLKVGPNIQDDVFSLLVRFRSHPYAVTADIEKMYRQINLHPSDRKFQKILWREDDRQPIKVFTLNTITYGTSSASFLATRSLKQLADDEISTFPNASIALREDFYMDDLLTGARSIEDAKQIVNELIHVTRKCGMNVRQWASNESELISALSGESDNPYLCLNLGDKTKTLGVYWNPKADSFFYTVNQSSNDVLLTKRLMLSQIAQLFDPLGLLGPVIVQAKIMMQSLWLLKLDWDEAVPEKVQTVWREYRNQLTLLDKIDINRKIVTNDYVTLQMHGFCDASGDAYGACIYIRSTDRNGIHSTQLVCSKSKVAPVKTLSIPRLELCAALLLSKLYTSVSHALRRITIEKTIFWSDSTIVLNYILNSPHTFETFEANRITVIQALTSSCEWRHVRTEHNPADLVSRGLFPKELIDNVVWMHGPLWLNDNEENWPISILRTNEELPGRRKPKLFANLTYKNDIASKLFEKLGSFTKLIHVVAYCQRFINSKTLKVESKGNLSINELKKAKLCVIKLLQREAFFNELKILETSGEIVGNLMQLTPFLDSEGILRVGGRLSQSNLTYSQKHPILLPKNHRVTTLIIHEQHMKLFHAGTQATLGAIRNEYWIVNGRSAVKNIIRKCVICCRAKPRIPDYLMGNLPKNRTVFERAFLHTGIDYCGPFYIKERKFRNRSKVKIYAAVFVCFATKAIHIEIVSDLTSEAFLACLKRFFARRGKSSDLYSDNATNFQGAQREISEICKFLKSQENNDKISRVLADENINWHFIPPRSPHFGGLWEAAVKAFKHHIVRVIGERILTYEEFTTVTIEIEGILNSRPLTPLSSDPNDLTVLTPGHFLIGDSITNMPEQNLLNVPSGRLSSWQQVQQIKQHFWNRWYKEYLHELTVRKKWHKGYTHNMQVGTIVTIRDDNLPPMRWSLGRVIATMPGKDGIIRVVIVKTVRGEYKLSVKRLSPLPIDIM